MLVQYRHVLRHLIDCCIRMSRRLVSCSARRGKDAVLRGSAFERLQVIILEGQFQEVHLNWLWGVIVTSGFGPRGRLRLNLRVFIGVDVPVRLVRVISGAGS
jgi:hypothetical protein